MDDILKSWQIKNRQSHFFYFTESHGITYKSPKLEFCLVLILNDLCSIIFNYSAYCMQYFEPQSEIIFKPSFMKIFNLIFSSGKGFLNFFEKLSAIHVSSLWKKVYSDFIQYVTRLILNNFLGCRSWCVFCTYLFG